MSRLQNIVRALKNITFRFYIALLASFIPISLLGYNMYILSDFTPMHIMLTLFCGVIMFTVIYVVLVDSPHYNEDYWYEKKPLKNLFS